MGSWTETCAITNLPIRWNEQDVRLVVFKPFAKDSHSLKWMITDPETMVKCFKNIFVGDYNDYGRLETHKSLVEGFELPEDLKKDYQYFFAKGDVWDAVVKYVDKKINSSDEYEGWQYEHCISCFKTSMWFSRNSVIGKFPDYLCSGEEPSDPDDIQIPTWFTELLYVLAFLQNTRRDVWVGDAHRGSQTTNYEEHLLIAAKIQSHVFRQKV